VKEWLVVVALAALVIALIDVVRVAASQGRKRQ
jgi:hypothetical protein